MLSKKFTAVAGAAAEATDDYFKNVSLLLSGDGTNGAQNNGPANPFLDSSTNNFSITRNGNTTQGSYSPYGSLWSNYSNGSGYLSAPSDAVFAFGTNDFTVECWIFLTSTTSAPYNNPRAFNVGGFNLYSDGANSGKWAVYFGASNIITTTAALTLNQWTHLALVRSGTSLVLYINGVSAGSTTNSSNISAAAAYFLTSGSSDIATGYLSNARIVKGVAVYTGTFTVPTTPLSITQSAGTNIAAITGSQTSLLTAQSNRFIDNSNTALTITASGSPSVQRFSPFNPTAAYSTATIGGSGYFDGSGDYLSVPYSTVFDYGTGDFTIEAWVYLTASPAAGSCIVGSLTSGGTDFQFRSSTELALGSNGLAWRFTSNSTTFPLNTWMHLAVTRASGVAYMWKDGVSIGSGTETTSFNAASGDVTIGRSSDGYFAGGYISNVRVTKGGALYTSAFTPSTAPLTTTVGSGTVSLLTNFTNAGIYDNAMMNDLETVGNAQISTSVKKYGTGSIAFDGTGDYLQIPASPNLTFGTGAFTVECWFRVASAGTRYNLFGNIGSGDSSFGAYIFTDGTVRSGTYNTNLAVSTGTISANTWYYYAFTWDGTTYRQFINGTVDGTSSTAKNLSDSTTVWQVGAIPWTSSYQLNGYIDDLRITKGLARYTSNFTAPTEALPAY